MSKKKRRLESKLKTQLSFTQDSDHFAASRAAPEISKWNPRTTSADSSILPEQALIRDRNQDLYRNNGIAAGAKQTYKDNIIGTGLRLCAKPNFTLLGRDMDWATEWSKTVEAHWNNHAESFFFDSAMQSTFDMHTTQVLDNSIQNGDACIIPLWIPRRGSLSTTFQIIDSTRLSNPNNQMDTTTFKGGIEFGRYGEPLAYHVKNSHPGDDLFTANDETWTRIPARTRFGRSRFIHLYDSDRPGQSRGKPVATSVLAAFNMSGEYQITELQAAIVNSKIAAFIESNMSSEEAMSMLGIDSDEYIKGRNEWKASLNSGAVIQVPIGDKLSSFTPSRPATAYSDYMEQIAREIGVGLNMPYELVMKNFSKTNYSSARAALLEAWRYFNGRRKWISVNWASIAYELVLEELVNKKIIEAPGFYDNKNAYCRSEWIGPGRGAVDPLKEANADVVMLDNNLTTHRELYAKQGKDWRHEFEQIAIENKEMERLSLSKKEINDSLMGSRMNDLESKQSDAEEAAA